MYEKFAAHSRYTNALSTSSRHIHTDQKPCNGRIDSPCPAPRGGRPQPHRGPEMESDVEHRATRWHAT